MTKIRKIGRYLLRACLLSTCLLLLGYGALLAINRHDEPVSTQAQSLIDAYNARSTPADGDNAYLYQLGFSAPPGQAPIELGQHRVAWMRWAQQQPNRADLLEQEQQRPSPFAARTNSFSTLLKACESSAPECGALLIANETDIDNWLHDEHFLLERYHGLISLPDMHEPLPYDIHSAFPDYVTLFDGQRLLLTQAWLASRQGNAEETLQLLEADLRFWRMALARADILLPKMIAVSAIKRHFLWGMRALKQLPTERPQASIPPYWQEPLNAEERSMRRTLSGEQAFSVRLITQVKGGEFSGIDTGDGVPLKQQLLYSLGLPFLQPQATNNQNADFLLDIEKAFTAPYKQLSKVRAQAATFRSKRQHNYLYNLTGNLLAEEFDDGDFANYLGRIYDLEGVRRAALLLATLHSQGIARQDVGSLLNQSELNDPYTDTPFSWNPNTGELSVQGLNRDSRLTFSY